MSLHISLRLSAQIFSVLIDILVVIIYCIILKFNIYGITQDPCKFEEWKNDNDHSQVPNKEITILFKINYCYLFFLLEIEPNRRHYICLCGGQPEFKCHIHLKMSGYPMKYSFGIKNSFWGAYMLKYLTFTRSFSSGMFCFKAQMRHEVTGFNNMQISILTQRLIGLNTLEIF